MVQAEVRSTEEDKPERKINRPLKKGGWMKWHLPDLERDLTLTEL